MTEAQGDTLIAAVSAMRDQLAATRSVAVLQVEHTWLMVIGVSLLALVFLQAARLMRSL